MNKLISHTLYGNMRHYTKYDLIRFRNFSKDNPTLKPVKLIQAYDAKFPELSSKEKLINISLALGINDLYKSLTGEDIPKDKRLDFLEK